jgi:type II secretory ATPase GspE/PulE/Tfp pilus assembly ATPase PilB-like protein
VRKIVVDHGTPQEVRHIAVEQGMRTMGSEAMALVADDVTTIDEIRRTVYVS